MTLSSVTKTAPVSVNFSAAEKRMLMLRARSAGQTLGEYIRERVVVESGPFEQVLRFLAEELALVGDQARQAVTAQQAESAGSSGHPRESREAQRARIAKEVRETLTQNELDALASLFRPAFDAPLGLTPPKHSAPKNPEKQ